LGQSAIAVAAGRDHTCALLADGGVACWGQNDAGQLGLGDSHPRGRDDAAFTRVDLGGRFATTVTTGRSHTCALLDDGMVACWGANESGQLGLGDTRNRGDRPGQMGKALSRVPL
jgi:alpha-tubulin suppressor-like RCC1 family protein